jgi:hypothetical protein
MFFLFNIHGVCNDSPCFIFDICIFVFCLHLCQLTRVLSMLLIFSRKLWFHWFFSTHFLFLIILFSVCL